MQLKRRSSGKYKPITIIGGKSYISPIHIRNPEVLNSTVTHDKMVIRVDGLPLNCRLLEEGEDFVAWRNDESIVDELANRFDRRWLNS